MRARTLLLLPLLALLVACSKTVTWEEEVPLNTGDTIWVKRVVTYKYQGASGNPLDMAYRPDWTETLEFDWQGKKYSYTGDADLMLLAISPVDKGPVLLARADLKNWDRSNQFRCVVPFYVQFKPNETGREWSWPPQIEAWLYHTGSNLMLHRPKLAEVKRRYSVSDRDSKDAITRAQSPSLASVDPIDKFDSCRN
jgi:hypothetical protein